MSATTQLLERDEELAAIRQLLDASVGGAGARLMIEGEAGAGKTTLLEAAADEAGVRGMMVLRARGGEYERDFPYGIVRQLFESRLRDGARRRELLTGSAALAAPVFEPDTAPAEGGDPFAVEHGLYWLLADLSSSEPVLLVVDDAQWADLASLRVLAYIARRLDGLTACLALAVRTGDPTEPVGLLDELRREAGANIVEPRALSAQAAAVLVEGEIGHEPSRRLAEKCREATAGNPFLLAQLARALGPVELGEGEAGVERLSELAATGVSRSIQARLGQLGGHAVDIAEAVAILEPNAELRRVSALASLPVEEVIEAGERLIGTGLLADARPLSFVHPLVRAAVLAEVSAPGRAAAHARAARLLHNDGVEVDSVAAHLLLAEPVADPWVVEELRSAAAAALGRGAPDAAVRYLRRALREPPTNADRPAVSRELGLALLRANDPEGIEVLRTLRAGTDDATSRAEIATELASSLGLREGTDEAAALLEESQSELSDPDSRLGLLVRGWLLLQTIWGLERVPEGVLPRRGREPPPDDLPGRLVLQQAAVLCAAGLDSIDRGRELAEAVVSDREGLMKDAMAGLPPQAALVALTLADRGELSEPLFDLAIEASRRRGSLPGVGGGHGIRGLFHLLAGDLRDAQADAEVAMGVTQRVGLRAPLGIWSGVVCSALTARGDLDAAERLLIEMWGERELISGIPGSILLCARGELRQAMGRHAEARHDFLAAAERVSWLPFANPEVSPWRIGLALCEAALGNHMEARSMATEAVELARKAGGRRGIGITTRVLGTVSDGEEQIELLQQSVVMLASTRARLQHARALVELGAALRRANRRKEARAPLREGLELAHRCGAAPLEERARVELAATGARPRKAVLSGVDALTPSELRVAHLAAEGMTNREIAQSLTVTAKTVETHMRHIFQKLDLTRRTELAAALGRG